TPRTVIGDLYPQRAALGPRGQFLTQPTGRLTLAEALGSIADELADAPRRGVDLEVVGADDGGSVFVNGGGPNDNGWGDCCRWNGRRLDSRLRFRAKGAESPGAGAAEGGCKDAHRCQQ